MYEAYLNCIPEKNRWMLEKKIDFQRDGIDLHLEELAEVFEGWDKIAPLLDLTGIDIYGIEHDNRSLADRRSVIHKYGLG
jgi:hypothetical protein